MTDPRFISGSSGLTRLDYKTLWLATLGGVLEFYDFIIFVFFATTIGELFFPPGAPDWVQQFQAFGVFAVGYFVRPLGGIIMAHAGDLRGRKRMFTFSIFLMGLSTFGIGLLPTYATLGPLAPICLLLLRIGQGAAVGGEVPGAWVFVSEHVPRSRVGIACGLLTAGLTAGILLGSLVATGLNQWMPAEQLTNYGWRIAFVLGGAFGLISVYLRRLLAETPVFVELKARRALAAELPLKAVVRDYRPAIVVSALLTWLLSAAIVVIILMTPALFEKAYHVPRLESLQANCLATLALTAGVILVGWLTDRFGPAAVLLAGCPLFGIAAYLLYAGVRTNPALLMPLYALAGLTVGIVAVVPYVMINAFPAWIRFTGVSFSYNIAYAVFGGITPLIVSWLLHFDLLAPAHYIGAVCLLGFGIGIVLFSSSRRAD
ncbi:MAG: MFS transporter [Verrucomicrobia bacterium]|nr:MFS transporter [Verrucomicrobiota bacterium]